MTIQNRIAANVTAISSVETIALANTATATTPSLPLQKPEAPLQPAQPPEILKTVYLATELDRQPEPVGPISLEPEQGYPEYVSGRAEVSLLISETGETQWVGIDYSEFDETVNQRITEGFLAARFLPAMVGSTAVKTIIQVEVNIEKLTPVSPIH